VLWWTLVSLLPQLPGERDVDAMMNGHGLARLMLAAKRGNKDVALGLVGTVRA
jgi:hypothetical protein